MPKGIRRSDAQKAIQKERTRQNKKRKYEKLLKERPNDLHTAVWKEQIKFNS